MRGKDLEEQVIRNFQQDEQMMILVFAQWCINHELDPIELYERAYPKQASSPPLQKALSLTVPKEEAGVIADDTVLGVLSLFGNDDLVIVVSAEINKRK